MEDFVNFITQYWKVIALAVVVILEVIILIFKRVKLSYTLPSDTTKVLIDLVCEAENKFGEGHGKEKLEYVLTEYAKYYYSSYPGWFISSMQGAIKPLIEKILSTPTKKGGPGREQDN